MRKSIIQSAIENNRVDFWIKDTAETNFRMSFGKPIFKGSWTLEQHIEAARKEVDAVLAEMNEEKETFTLSLNYNDFESRSKVKSLGGKWNPDTKTWTVTCKRSELGNLSDKISMGRHTWGWGDLEGMFGASGE